MREPSASTVGERIIASDCREMKRPDSSADCQRVRSAAVAHTAPAANGSDQVIAVVASAPDATVWPLAIPGTSCAPHKDDEVMPSGRKTSSRT